MAVISSLQKVNKDLKVTYIGSRFGIESTLIPKMGIKYFGISAGKFRRYHRSAILNLLDPTTIYKNIKDLFAFIKGIGEARKILLHEKPDVVFAKGGFVSFPVGIAARLTKIPLVIHESDLVMGLANKRMATFANKVCVSFPERNFKEIPKEKLVYTGNPVREDILGGRGRLLLDEIGFDRKRKTILVLGGSQGSQFLNETIYKIGEELAREYQVIWIAGERDADWLSHLIKKEIKKEFQKYLKVYGFITTEIADVYDASDLVISRSGSNVLFELAALGKPAILIPHDVSPGGHQYQNARAFSRTGAAFIVRQETLEPKKILKDIRLLLENENQLNDMSEKMKAWSMPDAAGKVAQIIYEEGVRHIEQTRKLEEHQN